jgi:hypothetical protein
MWEAVAIANIKARSQRMFMESSMRKISPTDGVAIPRIRFALFIRGIATPSVGNSFLG